MTETMYYFSAADRRLRYGDNRTIEAGITHRVDTSMRGLGLCRHGLHASQTPFQALKYAPGPVLWQVRLGGEILVGEDKCCASERTYLAGFDATDVLRAFARRQALINIEKIHPYCPPSDYALVMAWLETADEKLRDSAESAAWSAAWSARSAAESAWSAAWSARSAAESAAESAAYRAAGGMLNELLREATGWKI